MISCRGAQFPKDVIPFAGLRCTNRLTIGLPLFPHRLVARPL